MIKVEKDFSKVPNHLINGGTDYNHQDVKDALSAIYNNKCCYCEHKSGAFEVEHYRPKKKPKGKTPKHNGYPWLQLEWSNLLWSCVSCNRGTGGKHTKFPIKTPPNNRIFAPTTNITDNLANSAYLLNENALLLHPEIDNPEEHLSVASGNKGVEAGKLVPINNSPKGKATIDVCNLNRDLLFDARKTAIESICKWVRDLFEQAYKLLIQNPTLNHEIILMEQLELIFKRIKENKNASSEFALLHRVFYEQFDEFIDMNIDIKDYLTSSSINAIKQTFAAYKLKNP